MLILCGCSNESLNEIETPVSNIQENEAFSPQLAPCIDRDCPELSLATFSIINFGHWIARVTIFGFEERHDRVVIEPFFELRGVLNHATFDYSNHCVEIKLNGELVGWQQEFAGFTWGSDNPPPPQPGNTFLFSATLELREGDNEVVVTVFYPEANEYYQRILHLYFDKTISPCDLRSPSVQRVSTEHGRLIRKENPSAIYVYDTVTIAETTVIIVTVEDDIDSDVRVFVMNDMNEQLTIEAKQIERGTFQFEVHPAPAELNPTITIIAVNRWGNIDRMSFCTSTPKDTETAELIRELVGRTVRLTLSDVFETDEHLSFETNIGEIVDGEWSFTLSEVGIFHIEINASNESYNQTIRFWVLSETLGWD